MFKKRTQTLFLALLLAVTAIAPSALAEVAGSFTNIAAAPANPLYTPLEIPGYSHTVYAFAGLEGKTQFRVYGQSGSQIGFFPVTISAGSTYLPGGALQVALTAGAAPAQDNMAAVTATLSPTAAPVPMGFTAGGAPAIVVMENLFGQKESLAYASYDGQNFVYLPANNNLPVPGALPAVVEDMATRAKLSWENSFPLPFNLQNGFKTQARILTSDGVEVTLSTAYPAIDRASLAQPQAAQPTVQPVYQPTARPAATKRPYTSAKRTPKPTATLKPGTTPTPKALKYGVISDEVKALQNRLAALGYDVGKIDGNFGRATQKALIAFQKNNGLKGDGVAGATTLAKLNSASALPASQIPGAVKIPLTISVSVNKTEALVGDSITWNATAKGWGPGTYKFVDMLVLLNGVPYKTSKISNGESGSISITPDKPGTYSITVTAGSSSYVINKVTYYDNATVANTAAVVVKDKPTTPYVFKDHVKVSVSMAKTTFVEGESASATANVAYTGDKPASVSFEFAIYDASHKELAWVNKAFPQTISVSNLKPGTYTARAYAGPGDSGGVSDSITFTVTAKDAPAPVVTTETVTETAEIAITTEERNNPEMDKGTTTVVQEGKAGLKTITITITKTDGVETKREITKEEITTPMVPKIVEVGTKPVVTTETITETQAIPFTTEEKNNPEMDKGTTKVVQEGVDGVKTITYTITKTDGVETGRVKTNEEVTTSPVTKIVEIGTKEAPAAAS